MRIIGLFHSDLGGEIHLPDWARRRGHDWLELQVPEADELPTPEQADALIVMGGPMSAWDEERFPWLAREKRTLESFIEADRPVLGICLGAQILAEVLGAKAYAGDRPEIGWFRVEVTADSHRHRLGELLPQRFETFLWHADTFEIPPGAVHLAGSARYPNQAFAWGQVLGLQFHLEVRPDWVRRICARDSEQLVGSETVQSVQEIIEKDTRLFHANNLLLERLLDRWVGCESDAGTRRKREARRYIRKRPA